MLRHFYSMFLLVLGASCMVVLSVVLAWQDPTANPPSGGGKFQTDALGNLLMNSGDLKLQGPSDLFVENGTASLGSGNPPLSNQQVFIRGNLQVGEVGFAKGITLYDVNNTTAAYCLRIATGSVQLISGTCP